MKCTECGFANKTWPRGERCPICRADTPHPPHDMSRTPNCLSLEVIEVDYHNWSTLSGRRRMDWAKEQGFFDGLINQGDM